MQFITAYKVNRHYGGPEKGGWWWNALDLIQTVTVLNNDDAPAMVETLQAKYQDKAEGDIYSVLGGTGIAVYIEDLPGENTTTRTPHYE